MNAPTDHSATTKDKQQRDRMPLPPGPITPNTKRQPVHALNPAARDPVRHHGGDGQRGGDRGALEVLALPRRVLGEGGDGDVEARETAQTAEHEEGEQERVDGCA